MAAPVDIEQDDTWSRPECRPEVVQTMISGVDRYNHENIGLLEEYLANQLEQDTYDCLSNLAILKLYQFSPTLVENNGTIYQILLQAIAHRPFGPDFSLGMALLTERLNPLYSDDAALKSFESLSELSTLLAERKFKKFWEKVKEHKDLVSIHPRVEKITRESIARDCISTIFQSLPVERMRTWLGLTANDKAEEKELLSSLGWSLGNDGLVHIPSNSENAPVEKVHKETIQLDRLTKVLRQSQQS